MFRNDSITIDKDWLQIKFPYLPPKKYNFPLTNITVTELYCTELLLQFSFCSDLTLPNVTLFWNCNQEMVFDYITRGWTQLNNISTFVRFSIHITYNNFYKGFAVKGKIYPWPWFPSQKIKESLTYNDSKSPGHRLWTIQHLRVVEWKDAKIVKVCMFSWFLPD